MTPKRPEAICLIAELALSPLACGLKRAGSSPPSPESDLAPMRFMAIASVSCASGDSAPSDMPGVTKRLRISVIALDLVDRRSPCRVGSGSPADRADGSAAAPCATASRSACRGLIAVVSRPLSAAGGSAAPRRRGSRRRCGSDRSRRSAARSTSSSQALRVHGATRFWMPAEADAGDARRHAGEEFVDQRCATGRPPRNCSRRDRCEMTAMPILDMILSSPSSIALCDSVRAHSLERQIAEQAARVAVGDASPPPDRRSPWSRRRRSARRNNACRGIRPSAR